MKPVKIPNSTQWSNLYLAESKYNIQVTPLKKVELFIVKVLTFFGQKRNASKLHQFVVDESGEVSFNMLSSYFLHTHSRVGWFGCWLICVENKADIQTLHAFSNAKHFYIAKHRVSSTDYARLTRIIHHHNRKNKS